MQTMEFSDLSTSSNHRGIDKYTPFQTNIISDNYMQTKLSTGKDIQKQSQYEEFKHFEADQKQQISNISNSKEKYQPYEEVQKVPPVEKKSSQLNKDIKVNNYQFAIINPQDYNLNQNSLLASFKPQSQSQQYQQKDQFPPPPSQFKVNYSSTQNETKLTQSENQSNNIPLNWTFSPNNNLLSKNISFQTPNDTFSALKNVEKDDPTIQLSPRSHLQLFYSYSDKEKTAGIDKQQSSQRSILHLNPSHQFSSNPSTAFNSPQKMHAKGDSSENILGNNAGQLLDNSSPQSFFSNRVDSLQLAKSCDFTKISYEIPKNDFILENKSNSGAQLYQLSHLSKDIQNIIQTSQEKIRLIKQSSSRQNLQQKSPIDSIKEIAKKDSNNDLQISSPSIQKKEHFNFQDEQPSFSNDLPKDSNIFEFPKLIKSDSESNISIQKQENHHPHHQHRYQQSLFLIQMQKESQQQAQTLLQQQQQSQPLHQQKQFELYEKDQQQNKYPFQQNQKPLSLFFKQQQTSSQEEVQQPLSSRSQIQQTQQLSQEQPQSSPSNQQQSLSSPLKQQQTQYLPKEQIPLSLPLKEQQSSFQLSSLLSLTSPFKQQQAQQLEKEQLPKASPFKEQQSSFQFISQQPLLSPLKLQQPFQEQPQVAQSPYSSPFNQQQSFQQQPQMRQSPYSQPLKQEQSLFKQYLQKQQEQVAQSPYSSASSIQSSFQQQPQVAQSPYSSPLKQEQSSFIQYQQQQEQKQEQQIKKIDNTDIFSFKPVEIIQQEKREVLSDTKLNQSNSSLDSEVKIGTNKSKNQQIPILPLNLPKINQMTDKSLSTPAVISYAYSARSPKNVFEISSPTEISKRQNNQKINITSLNYSWCPSATTTPLSTPPHQQSSETSKVVPISFSSEGSKDVPLQSTETLKSETFTYEAYKPAVTLGTTQTLKNKIISQPTEVVTQQSVPLSDPTTISNVTPISKSPETQKVESFTYEAYKPSFGSQTFEISTALPTFQSNSKSVPQSQSTEIPKFPFLPPSISKNELFSYDAYKPVLTSQTTDASKSSPETSKILPKSYEDSIPVFASQETETSKSKLTSQLDEVVNLFNAIQKQFSQSNIQNTSDNSKSTPLPPSQTIESSKSVTSYEAPQPVPGSQSTEIQKSLPISQPTEVETLSHNTSNSVPMSKVSEISKIDAISQITSIQKIMPDSQPNETISSNSMTQNYLQSASQIQNQNSYSSTPQIQSVISSNILPIPSDQKSEPQTLLYSPTLQTSELKPILEGNSKLQGQSEKAKENNQFNQSMKENSEIIDFTSIPNQKINLQAVRANIISPLNFSNESQLFSPSNSYLSPRSKQTDPQQFQLSSPYNSPKAQIPNSQKFQFISPHQSPKSSLSNFSNQHQKFQPLSPFHSPKQELLTSHFSQQQPQSLPTQQSQPQPLKQAQPQPLKQIQQQQVVYTPFPDKQPYQTFTQKQQLLQSDLPARKTLYPHEQVQQQPQKQDEKLNNYKRVDSFEKQKSLFSKNYTSNDYKYVKKLGKGQHSQVFLAQDNRTGFLFAVKKVSKADIIKQQMEEQFSSEIKVQMSLHHPNIIHLYGFNHDKEFFYLFMEYAPGGELYKYLKSKAGGVFLETEASYFLIQLGNALSYCHRKQIIHRDLKPENLMIANGVLKLGDFGYSRMCDIKSTRSTFCGTLDYLSPKIVGGKKYNQEIDIWSFGVIAYEFLQGVAPFFEISKIRTMDKIVAGQYEFQKEISKDAKDFIAKLLTQEEEDLMTMRQACQNKWLLHNIEKYQKENDNILIKGLDKLLQ